MDLPSRSTHPSAPRRLRLNEDLGALASSGGSASSSDGTCRGESGDESLDVLLWDVGPQPIEAAEVAVGLVGGNETLSGRPASS